MKKESHGIIMTVEARQLLEDKSVPTLKSRKNFITYLHYCAERLYKGVPIQAIWNDYQAKAR